MKLIGLVAALAALVLAMLLFRPPGETSPPSAPSRKIADPTGDVGTHGRVGAEGARGREEAPALVEPELQADRERASERLLGLNKAKVTLRVEAIPAPFSMKASVEEPPAADDVIGPVQPSVVVQVIGTAAGSQELEPAIHMDAPNAGPEQAGSVTWHLEPGRYEARAVVTGHAGVCTVELPEFEVGTDDVELHPCKPFAEVDLMWVRLRAPEGKRPTEIRIAMALGSTGQVYACRSLPLPDGSDGAGIYSLVACRGVAPRLFVNTAESGELIAPFRPGRHELLLPVRPDALITWIRGAQAPERADLIVERALEPGAWIPPGSERLLLLDHAVDITSTPGFFVPMGFEGPGRYRIRDSEERFAPFEIDVAPGASRFDVVVPPDDR